MIGTEVWPSGRGRRERRGTHRDYVSALAWLNPAATRALLGRDAAAPGGDLFTGPDRLDAVALA